MLRYLARWAWVAVLVTALSLSWWSLDALAVRYGMPGVLAGMVSATFDGAALAAAELGMRHAREADSAGAVRLLMLGAVGLSGWLNWEHGALLGYPGAVRVLFAAPPVVAGALFELELRYAHRARLRELGRVAPPLPPLGAAAWLLHPVLAVRKIDALTASRIASVPATAMDWTQVAAVDRALEEQIGGAIEPPSDGTTDGTPEPPSDGTPRRGAPRLRPGHRAPDAEWLPLARAVAQDVGEIPSQRQLMARLGVGWDRAARLVPLLAAEQLGGQAEASAS